MKLLIATRNAHKMSEIAAILNWPGVEPVSVADIVDAPDVVEDGLTFEANAVKKADALARATGMFALADDSGLEVDALGGAPGVYSARYAGEPADYAANNRKLLEEMRGRADRSARFRCVMALSTPSGESLTVEGACEGTITRRPRGKRGFGYDPVFVPARYSETFAEMTADLKNRISHRAAALRAARSAFAELLTGPRSV